MPWDKKSFHKHNKKLSSAQSGKAARTANAILKKTGDEGKAIAIANSQAKKSSMQKYINKRRKEHKQ